MKVLYIGRRDPNHSKFGGYDYIAKNPNTDYYDCNKTIFAKIPEGTPGKGILMYFCGFCYSLLKRNEYDVIHNFYGDFMLYAKCPKNKKAKYVATIHLKTEKLSKRKMRILKTYDAVIVLSKSEQLYLRQKGVNAFFIPHGFNAPVFEKSVSEKNAVDKIKLNIFYSGMNYRDFNTFTRIASFVKEKRRDIVFHAVGQSASNKAILKNHENVKVYERLTDNEYYSLLNECDYNFLPLTFATANNALLEAQTLGKISILPNISGLTDYADKENNIFYNNASELESLFMSITPPHTRYLYSGAQELFRTLCLEKCVPKAERIVSKNSSFTLDKIIYVRNRIARNGVNALKRIFIHNRKLLLPKKDVVIIFDHNLGGGTASYTKNLISSFKEKGENVVRITSLYSSFGDLAYKVDYENKYNYVSFKALQKVLESVSIKKIIVNSLITYYRVLDFTKLIQDLAYKNKAALIIMFHDFYPLCTKYNLFCNGKNCNEYCKWNTKMNIPFTVKKINILEWTQNWSSLFKASTELRVFSESSKETLLQYIKEFENKINVVPHSLTYLQNIKPIPFIKNTSMKVGIIGAINTEIKGLQIVKDLSKKIDLYILGNTNIQSRHIHKCGSYTLETLKEKVIDSGVNVILFPSIWRETFSYVVSEIMALSLPCVSFALGAQKEKIESYKKGVICKDYKIESVIESLQKAYKLNE